MNSTICRDALFQGTLTFIGFQKFSVLFCFVLEPLINFSGFFMLNSLVIKNNYYICIYKL